MIEFLKSGPGRMASIALFAIGLAMVTWFIFQLRRLSKEAPGEAPKALLWQLSLASLIESAGVVGFFLGGGFGH